MQQSGQGMLDSTIAACQQIADGLGSQDPAWEGSITEIVERFNEVSGTFFFKTIPSVPATRTTMRNASALLELRENKDWDNFGPALEQLIKSAQDLIEQAGMKGTTLT